MIKEILSLVNLPYILTFINPFLTQQHLEYIKAGCIINGVDGRNFH